MGKERYYVVPAKRQRLEQLESQVRRESMIGDDGRPRVEHHGEATIAPVGLVDEAELNRQGRIVDDCDYCADLRQVSPTTDDLRYRDKTAVYCGYMRHIWGHFLMNTSARLWYAVGEWCKADYVVLCTDNGDCSLLGNYREFFRLLGLLDKVLIIDRPTAFASVEVPELSFALERWLAPEFHQVMERVCEAALREVPQAAGSGERVMLTRSQWHGGAKGSPELGIERIDRFFSNAGYRVVAPERLSLTELICTMRRATSVAVVTCSASHNAVFCRRGVDLVLIERMAHCNLFQPYVNASVDAKVTYVDCALAIRPVNIGLGPWLYYPTRRLAEFAADRGIPTPEGMTPEELRRLLGRYLRLYRRNYGRELYFGRWRQADGQAFVESLVEANEVAGHWLRGDEPLYLADRLRLKPLARKLLKLLKKK